MTSSSSVASALGGRPQQLAGGSGRADVVLAYGEPGAREVDVAVDHAGDDRGPGELDDAVGPGRVTHPDPLDVTIVDQQPIAGRRVPQGVDDPRAIEGSHARMMPWAAPPARDVAVPGAAHKVRRFGHPSLGLVLSEVQLP